MSRSYRKDRLGEEIRKIISDLLLKGLKDPRFSGLISITAVDVTKDYSYATVYYSTMDISAIEYDRLQEVQEAFESASGFIRNNISRELKLKRAPELVFKVDTSMKYGQHIDEIIDSLDINPNESEDAKS